MARLLEIVFWTELEGFSKEWILKRGIMEKIKCSLEEDGNDQSICVFAHGKYRHV